MREYDMDDGNDMENMEETVKKVFMPCMEALGDVDDLFLFRSLLASFIENWAMRYDYDPVYVAVSTANIITEVHCNGEFEEYDDDEDEE